LKRKGEKEREGKRSEKERIRKRKTVWGEKSGIEDTEREKEGNREKKKDKKRGTNRLTELAIKSANPICFQPTKSDSLLTYCSILCFILSEHLSYFSQVIRIRIISHIFKGTVSRDFLLLVLFMNQFPPSPRVFH
jgi:hypothetical protein